MPIYGYICQNSTCVYEFETEQRMVDNALVKCPQCKKKTLIRKIYAPNFFIKGDPTTVGHQAARNTEKLGHYEYQDKMAERKTRIRRASDKMLEASGGKLIEHSGELPWWRSGKVPGLPKKERPINSNEVNEITKNFDIRIKEPKPRKKKNGK